MDEVTKALIERLDAGANHQGYPEEFGQSWTKLCADAANTVRVLSAHLAAQSAAPVGDWYDGYREGFRDAKKLDESGLLAKPSPSGSPVGWGDDYPKDQSDD